ncbi:unnamed protein product [Medioppia subpectinata]|uniref:SMP-30/Gluconolactonase/LRE-like region domain-containing protein n=1 Tax=Medioppia subpectinata TaxID=1979941 RepID=A0A7R9PY06_9ACAR|nr:unnamed protein product [Medioppia subpectinata]CAG2104571.1 unnamed protein product [Medioppia subpectinata]
MPAFLYVYCEVAPELKGQERFNEGQPDKSGRMWLATVTDSLTPGDHSVLPGKGNLWTWESGKGFTKRADNFYLTNGITWSHDQKKLFINDSEGRKIYVFDFDLDKGTVANRKVLVDAETNTDWTVNDHPDGLTIDITGHLWAASYAAGRVVKVDPNTGDVVDTCAIPCPLVTTPVFGGPNMDQMFITTAYKNFGPDQHPAHPTCGKVHRITSDDKNFAAFNASELSTNITASDPILEIIPLNSTNSINSSHPKPIPTTASNNEYHILVVPKNTTTSSTTPQPSARPNTTLTITGLSNTSLTSTSLNSTSVSTPTLPSIPTNTTPINNTTTTSYSTGTTNTTGTNTTLPELAFKRKAYPDRTRTVNLNQHETNMVASDVTKVMQVLNATISRDYGSRKTARVLKVELDEAFKDSNYRFSVIIARNASALVCKRLYGVWMSVTANNKHYLLVGSYKANKAKKLSEGQMDRIEDWTSVYFINYEDMLEQPRYEKVARMLKEKLDLNYGKGNNNTWAVVAYKHTNSIRAKKLFDLTPQIQFRRLDGTVWLVFRGGEDIPDNVRNQG